MNRFQNSCGCADRCPPPCPAPFPPPPFPPQYVLGPTGPQGVQGIQGVPGPIGPTGAVYLGKMTVCKNAVPIKPPRYGY